MIDANAQIRERAEALAKANRHQEAERLWRQLLANTHVVDFEYDDWLRGAAATYLKLGRPREAGYVFLYLHQFAQALAAFHQGQLPIELARAREVEGRRTTGEVAREHFRAAAATYADAGRAVLAAVAYSLAGEPAKERRIWERVLADPRLRTMPYELALVEFNLGDACTRAGDRDEAERRFIHAQRLLEEVADDFESRGERERAFDCYAVLLKLGRDSGSYENLAEGYINCIRVLKEDNLKFYVLQYYEDFLRISLEREELHAAATVFREAADYARRVGLVYDRGYVRRAGETWWLAAEKNERDGGPVEMTENAYLAAVDAWNSIGDFARVRETYERLAKLALGDKKRARYAEVVTRYADVYQESSEAAPFPDYLRQQHAYPEIWYLDLIEWELDGEPAEVCASIVGDVRYADMIRRRALLVLLTILGAPRPDGEAAAAVEPQLLAQVAVGLGELQAYAALRPLERLSVHPAPEVRRGVQRALRNLYFKRSFQMISRGLAEPVPEVQKAALEALAALHFPHAFDPLTRIFREHEDARVREVALESIGRIASLEAGEFLIEVLRYEAPALRDVARRLLSQFDNADILPILMKHLELESGARREVWNDIVQKVRARGSYTPDWPRP
ncbi:MAG TPA: HEAT repeat domain-containing protein [Planctomycetota bacterium]|nr:HEAT repeat domain-containing protein [Planctomycetota bacterium]